MHLILRKILIFIIILIIFIYNKDLIFKPKKTEIIINKNNSFNNLINKFNYLINIYNKIYYFKIINIKYYFSFKYKYGKIEYNIVIYDEKENLISPSEISLYSNISLLCNIKLKNQNQNISIDSLTNIKINKYFNCIEFFNINERISFGIKIYNIYKNKDCHYISLFTDNLFNYNIIKYYQDNIFDYLIINNEYFSILKNVYNRKLNQNFKLKKSYIKQPLNSLKRNVIIDENNWKYENIMNNYFCLCRGQKCINLIIDQKCKFNFYVHIIDKSRDLYIKSDYLFVDFIFNEFSSDDVYPIFEKMEKQNYPVHYITEKKDIYNKYCNKLSKCLIIIPITRNIYYNDGDFLQKYLTLILKLKVLISGKYSCYKSISSLFYNAEYITYISVGHGVCYFKEHLFMNDRLYSSNRNDKILIPPSKKLIDVAKKYGWKDENIIKMNLPRWDKYYYEALTNVDDKKKFNKQSILLLFTWRDIKRNKDISDYYINNIISLLIDSNLQNALKTYKVTLYFTFHRFIINKYRNRYIPIIYNNKYINYIEQSEISDCLSETSLGVSDFSSIIFDYMYRKKPYILYVPDAKDPFIKDIYQEEYYQIIESLKNGTIYFENIFFDLNSTIEKIIYYIKNNFTVEENLLQFYDIFELYQGKNIDNFIKYLNNLK